MWKIRDIVEVIRLHRAASRAVRPENPLEDYCGTLVRATAKGEYRLETPRMRNYAILRKKLAFTNFRRSAQKAARFRCS